MAMVGAILIILLGFFLIFLVLIQKGRGGGLAGAFGGAGGSSAFGWRAGDTFTKVTIGVAAAWLFLIMITVKGTQPRPASESAPPAASTAPKDLPPEPGD